MKKTQKDVESELLVYINDDLKQDLQMLAIREGRSLKSIITEISIDYVKKHKEGNPQHLITKWQENEDIVGYPSMGIDFESKKGYIARNCVISNEYDDLRLNPFGIELWHHVIQWYEELKKL